MEPGGHNAITDVVGVQVGHATLISGDGALRPGNGPVRTGVTVIIPHNGEIWTEPVFAGAHRLNGNGELTGLEWVRENGMLGGAIGITNTHSVGVVRDALIEAAARAHAMRDNVWALPVSAKRTTVHSTTLTDSTFGPSTCMRPWRPLPVARSRRATWAVGPG